MLLTPLNEETWNAASKLRCLLLSLASGEGGELQLGEDPNYYQKAANKKAPLH